MAEVLGITSSIIALLQLTAKATSLSYEYIKSVNKAPGSVKKFIDELNHLTKVLGALQTFTSANPGSAALDKLNDQDSPLQECTQELQTFLQMLERKEVPGWRKILKRAKWPLKEKETLEFISRMERHKTLLILALSVDQSIAQSSGKQIENTLRDDEKRMRVLNWLYPDAFDKRHVEISAGGGKTFLCSLMIDDLKDLARTAHHGVAYIYFNYKEQGQQRPADILTSLAKQLACQIQHLPKDIGDLYNELQPKGERPTPEKLYSSLLSVARSFPQAFVVCDALDECDQEAQRKVLLPLFHRMAQDGVSLFLTSRGHPEDIQHSLGNLPKLELYARDQDIVYYIRQKIAENPRAERLVKQGKCEDQIISELKDCANGMFLLVHFHIKHMCQQTTVRQIMTELKKLKSSSEESEDHPMDPTYDRAMEALRRQSRSCKELALKILSWLVKARRVLTVRELQQAVSVEHGDTTYSELDLPDRKTLLDVCASLVTIDDKGDTVRLVHYTVQEYLLRSSVIPEDTDYKLSLTSIAFLSLDVFSQDDYSLDLSIRERFSTYPFLDYAALQLSFHLENCNEALTTKPLLQYLESVGNAEFYLKAAHHETPDSSPDYPKQAILYAAVVLGHCSVVRLVLGYPAIDINAPCCEGGTALTIGARIGKEPMARLLLEKGADISATDKYRFTALHNAALGGHEPVVRLLLEKGADISAIGPVSTALHCAVLNGYEPVVRLLLEKGAEILATGTLETTVLHSAAFRGDEPVVRLLLEKGADISATDSFGSTVLHSAAFSGHEPVVRLLLEKGADISATKTPGFTVLYSAVLRGHEPVVRLLLEKGADILAAGEDGRTVLYYAALGGGEPVVRLLLGKYAHILSTVLHHVALGGHEPVVQLFLEKYADILATGIGLQHYTMRHWEGTGALLEKCADILATDIHRSAIFHAASGGHEPVVRLLLEKYADILATDGDWSTALHNAALGEHEGSPATS